MPEHIEIAKHWLKRYLLLMEDVDSLVMRSEALMERSISPRSPIIDGLPHNVSKNTDRIGELISLCDSIEAEAKQKIAQAKIIYYEIDTTIKKIQGNGSADKRLVLQMKYLDGFGWKDINDALWLTKADFIDKEESYRRRTFKIHKKALINISELLAEFSGQEMSL